MADERRAGPATQHQPRTEPESHRRRGRFLQNLLKNPAFESAWSFRNAKDTRSPLKVGQGPPYKSPQFVGPKGGPWPTFNFVAGEEIRIVGAEPEQVY